MNELIALHNAQLDGAEQQTVNARELHAFLEVGKDFSNWIKARIEKYNFVENQDFIKFSPVLAKTTDGGRPSVEYHISLSMAKELAMVERNAKGKQARQYFIECEKIAKQKVVAPAFAIPQTLPEALRLAADLAEKNQILIEQQKVDAPKVDFCEQVTASSTEMTITKAAKVIGYPPRALKDYIRQIGWLYSNNDTPMQSAIEAGYLVLRFAHFTDSKGNPNEKPYPHVTAKGMYALYNRLRKLGKIERNEQLELIH